ncbi:hypothetical protein CDIK_1422 [Cucumispora dikerogammari]|nr:hypothetical protein CDIK_1422 [Cucumispora dikerogammari]
MDNKKTKSNETSEITKLYKVSLKDNELKYINSITETKDQNIKETEKTQDEIHNIFLNFLNSLGDDSSELNNKSKLQDKEQTGCNTKNYIENKALISKNKPENSEINAFFLENPTALCLFYMRCYPLIDRLHLRTKLNISLKGSETNTLSEIRAFLFGSSTVGIINSGNIISNNDNSDSKKIRIAYLINTLFFTRKLSKRVYIQIKQLYGSTLETQKLFRIGEKEYSKSQFKTGRMKQKDKWEDGRKIGDVKKELEDFYLKTPCNISVPLSVLVRSSIKNIYESGKLYKQEIKTLEDKNIDPKTLENGLENKNTEPRILGNELKNKIINKTSYLKNLKLYTTGKLLVINFEKFLICQNIYEDFQEIIVNTMHSLLDYKIKTLKEKIIIRQNIYASFRNRNSILKLRDLSSFLIKLQQSFVIKIDIQFDFNEMLVMYLKDEFSLKVDITAKSMAELRNESTFNVYNSAVEVPSDLISVDDLFDILLIRMSITARPFSPD